MVFVCFVAWVSMTALLKGWDVKKSTLECKNVCKEFLKALFEETQTQTQYQYPVLVGFDGNRILPQLVDVEFEKVRQNFAVCYCNNHTLEKDESLVIYSFAISRKPNSLEDEELEKLIQKQVEEILARTMRSCDCYIPTEPLTHVELKSTLLLIAFARNSRGVAKLDKAKKVVRRRRAEASQTSHTNLTENWNDKELQ